MFCFVSFSVPCASGARVGRRRQNEADRVDLVRCFYRLVYRGIDLRAAAENMAGEREEGGGGVCEGNKRRDWEIEWAILGVCRYLFYVKQ